MTTTRPPFPFDPLDYLDQDIAKIDYLTGQERGQIIGLRVQRAINAPRPEATDAQPAVGQVAPLPPDVVLFRSRA